MIRTRDFVVFAAILLFLLVGIAATWAVQSIRGGSQAAAAGEIDFAAPAEVAGAVIEERGDIPREDNIARLKGKIASGAGDVSAGAPIFTSVDDVASSAEPAVTDNTLPPSMQIGFTVYGEPLMSDELWRFVGFSATEQVGVAMDDRPIFGARTDNAPLDACGGLDEGLGYRYYLQLEQEIRPGCYGL